jgi:hypothetical protein
MSKNFIVSKHESNHVKTKVIYIYDNHPIVIEWRKLSSPEQIWTADPYIISVVL